MKTAPVRRPSIATTVLLTFVILKLTGQLDWSWWWVTSPAWIVLGLWACVLGLFGVSYVINPEGVKRFIRDREFERLCKEYFNATQRSK